jgi:hypothetical protein
VRWSRPTLFEFEPNETVPPDGTAHVWSPRRKVVALAVPEPSIEVGTWVGPAVRVVVLVAPVAVPPVP